MVVLEVRMLVDKAETLHGMTCWRTIGTLTPQRHILVGFVEQYGVDKHVALDIIKSVRMVLECGVEDTASSRCATNAITTSTWSYARIMAMNERPSAERMRAVYEKDLRVLARPDLSTKSSCTVLI